MATEIRKIAEAAAKELFADKYFRETALASNNHDDHAHAQEIAAAVIEKACSRLASRVEELEKGIAKRFDTHEWEGYRDVAICLVLGYCGFQQCQCGLPNIWERNGDKAYEMAESALAKHKEKK